LIIPIYPEVLVFMFFFFQYSYPIHSFSFLVMSLTIIFMALSYRFFSYFSFTVHSCSNMVTALTNIYVLYIFVLSWNTLYINVIAHKHVLYHILYIYVLYWNIMYFHVLTWSPPLKTSTWWNSEFWCSYLIPSLINIYFIMSCIYMSSFITSCVIIHSIISMFCIFCI
jgi:hypothetical protein